MEGKEKNFSRNEDQVSSSSSSFAELAKEVDSLEDDTHHCSLPRLVWHIPKGQAKKNQGGNESLRSSSFHDGEETGNTVPWSPLLLISLSKELKEDNDDDEKKKKKEGINEIK